MKGSWGAARGLLVLLLVAVSPASGNSVRAQAPTNVPPGQQAGEADRPSRTWRRLTSDNFVAVGDAPERVVRQALRELELFRSGLSQLSGLLPAVRFRSSTPLMVVFRNDSAFSPFKPRDSDGRRRNDVGGYYFDSPEGAHIVVAASTDQWANRLNIVLHEYAHDIVHFNLPGRLPPWLNEGLAELYASVAWDVDSRVPGRYLGRPIGAHLSTVRGGGRISDVLTVDDADLRVREPRRVGLFYAQSWALVHYIFFGRPDRRAGEVPAYLAALKAGQTPADAFQRAFRISVVELDEALANYVQLVSFPAARLESPREAESPVPAEPLLESEVDALEGYLLLRMGDLPAAEVRLSRALNRNPVSVDARVSLAQHRLAERRFGEAVDLLQPIANSVPPRHVARLYLGEALQKSGREQAAYEVFKSATSSAPVATVSVDSWFGLSLAAMSLDMLDEASAAMERVQSMEPQPEWYYRRARELWSLGRDADVLTDVQMFLRLTTTRGDAVPYAAFLGSLSAQRLGRADLAGELLSAAEPAATAPWTRTVLAYLRDQITDAAFLSNADNRGEETEARAYVGLRASLAGRREDAVLHLRWVKDRGAREYTEHAMAVAELTRLEKAESGGN